MTDEEAEEIIIALQDGEQIKLQTVIEGFGTHVLSIYRTHGSGGLTEDLKQELERGGPIFLVTDDNHPSYSNDWERSMFHCNRKFLKSVLRPLSFDRVVGALGRHFAV